MGDPRQSQNTVIKQLLRDTLTLLCKNTLAFNAELSIEGLLGLTVDKNEIILVSIGETISKNTNDFGDMLEPCQMARYSPGQAKLKGKKKRTSSRTGIFCSGPSRVDQASEGNVCLLESSGLVPETVKSKSEAMTIQVDFDFERIEVKEEQGVEESNSYVGYERTLPLQDHKRSQPHPHDAIAAAAPDLYDDDDCFLIEPISNVVQSNVGESQSNEPVDAQNDFKVFEQNVDSFMSVDQEIFREMFQADFATNALTYDVDDAATTGHGFHDNVSATTQSRQRRVQRRRSNFSKTDGGAVVGMNFPRTSGIHRRGYRFHCRYGYSSRILHQCTQCSATFTMSSNLGRHMTTMHNLNGDGGQSSCVFCPICQKQFSRSDNLARHLKQVHKHVTSSAAAAAVEQLPALLLSSDPSSDT